MKAAARFSKNHGFGSKDALDNVLGFSWAHFGCSRVPLKGSQADPPTFKNVDFMKAGARFWENDVFDPMMVLEAFWGSLGLLLGALAGLLEAFWGA